MPRYQVGEMPATYVKPARPQVQRPEDVSRLCRPIVRYCQEVFCALLLDARHRLLRKVTVSKGTLSASLVHPRDVFRSAIRMNAAAVVLVHNHPSGDPEPSHDDIDLTQRLVKSGKLLGIEVLDHVVVVEGGYVSLRERSLMDPEP